MLKDSDTVSFPSLPEGTIQDLAITDLSLRLFGVLEEDLAIDFEGTPRPYLETQILDCCTRNHQGRKLDHSFFWNLEIGKRTECLLKIATLANGFELNLRMRCLNLKCGEQMEIAMPLKPLLSMQQETDNIRRIELLLGDRKFSLRRPNGNDQLAWLGHSFLSEKAAVKTIVETLINEGQKDAFREVLIKEDYHWIPTINQAMEDFDPLVNFSLEVSCPYCGVQDVYSLDLGAWALQKLHAAQRQLIETVHCLAFYYHWNEGEILAIPPWRRSRYLSLIDREGNR